MRNDKPVKRSLIIRYRPALIALAAFVVYLIAMPDKREAATSSFVKQAITVFLVVPPIFLLLGLLDVWVPKETFIRFMGASSGIRGKLIAFALGSAAAGPLYGAFPVASVLMKKGASLDNVLIFIGAWSTTKIPMLLFEMQSLGARFALARLAIDIPGIILIAYAVKALLPAREIERSYEAAERRE
jgi:uncharacterized membrane protein YraQ (UPF0718 family)